MPVVHEVVDVPRQGFAIQILFKKQHLYSILVRRQFFFLEQQASSSERRDRLIARDRRKVIEEFVEAVSALQVVDQVA